MNFSMMISAGIICGLMAIPAPAQDKKSGDTETQVTGCLAQGGTADEFSIKDDKGRAYDLHASTGVNLKGHLGHKVTISGMRTAAKEKAKVHDDDHLMVTNLKMVSVNCT